MNTCDTCKWWKWPPMPLHTENDSKMKVCHNPIIGYGLKYKESATIPDEAARNLWFWTQPDFGCIQHESK